MITLILIALSLLATYGFWQHGRAEYIQGRCDAFHEISIHILDRDPRLGNMDDEEVAEWPIKAAIHQEVMSRWRRSIEGILDFKVYRQIKKEAE